MHPDEHVAGAGARDRHLRDLQDLQAAVPVLHKSHHVVASPTVTTTLARARLVRT